MSEKQTDTARETTRRQIAKAAAQLARQRDVVAERVTNGSYEAAAMGMRVLRPMETGLILMRNHLQIAEQQR